MLGKVIKYEFKATYRFVIMAYTLLLTLAVLVGVGMRINADEFFRNLAYKYELGIAVLSVTFGLLIVLLIIMTIIVISGMYFYSIKRFKDNLLNNQGYLMHTLPVKTRDHIFAKTIVSVVWTALSVVIVGFAYLVLAMIVGGSDVFASLFAMIKAINFSDFLNPEMYLYLCEVLIMWLISLISSYLHIFASMAIGFSLNTHKLAKSIGVYILITIVVSNFQSVVMLPTVLDKNFHWIMWLNIIVLVIQSVIYYFMAEYFLSKRLNLQ